MDIWCHGGNCGNTRGIKNGLFPSDSSWEILPFNLPPAAAESQHEEEHLCHFSSDSCRDRRQ